LSTISFTFEDLCALFTKYPSRLMVGMISTDSEAPEHVHRPHIAIKQNGVVKREYRGFDEVHGDITLDVHPKGRPLSRHTPRSGRDRRQPFNLVVDIEKQLYAGEALRPDARACRARLHFRNGELYAREHAVNASFADLRTRRPSADAPSAVATKVGLDVEVPEDGYAVLHFEGETEDFVFKGDRNYEVEVVNRADAITLNHFQYFYDIVRPKPKQKLVPVSAQSVGPTPRWGDWLCILAAFGLADYLPPKSQTKD
jgi:hypothetical protein